MSLFSLLGLKKPNPLGDTLLDGVRNAVAPQDPSQADITVTGQQLRPPEQPSLTTQPENLEALRVTPEQLQRMKPLEGLPQHKGVFGVKGTLRDILGMVGDSFLMGAGQKGIYGPGRQREKLSDALVGMGPGHESDAIARAMQVDPEVGTQLYKDWQTRLGKQAAEDRQQANLDRQTKRDERTLQLKKAAFIQNMAPMIKPEDHPAVQAFLENPDAALTDLPDYLQAASGMTQYQRATQGYRQDNLGERTRHNQATESIGRTNAAANTTRANKAATAKPRSQSELEYFQQVSNIPEGKRTKGQQAFYTKYTEGTKGNRRPPPGKTSTTSSGGGWGKMTVK